MNLDTIEPRDLEFQFSELLMISFRFLSGIKPAFLAKVIFIRLFEKNIPSNEKMQDFNEVRFY